MRDSEFKTLDETFKEISESLDEIKIIPLDYEKSFREFVLEVRGILMRLEDNINIRRHKQNCKAELMAIVRNLNMAIMDKAYSEGWTVEEVGPRSLFNKTVLWFRDVGTNKLYSSPDIFIDKITLHQNSAIEVIIELMCCGEGKEGKLYRLHEVYYTGIYEE